MSNETATIAQYPRMMAGIKPVLLLVGIAAAVAAGVSVVLWSRGPSYTLLYANLSTGDEAQVTQALDSAGIAYRIGPGSNDVQVPADKLNEARLKLAGQGLPQDDDFALLTKNPGFGVSQFMENARYQHVLENELARTIASLAPVAGARVQIATGHPSVFVREQHPGSASVFVQLKAGRQLSEEQVRSIVNLVASSVPDLDASRVTVVDQQGQLLSAPQGNDAYARRERHFQRVHQIEDEYSQRIIELLTPLVGAGHVRAQVVADIDTSVTEESSERYQPGSQIVRSEQVSQRTTRGGALQGGIPGSLSNEPPAAGVALPPRSRAPANPQDGSAPASDSGTTTGTQATQKSAAAATTSTADIGQPQSSSSKATRNYDINRTLAYTRRPAGQLKRLSVAVLLDDIHTVDKNGKPVVKPLGKAEIAHITQLVKDAVGFNAMRGDSVSVVNSSFQGIKPTADVPLQSVPLWQRPLFQEMLKLFAGLIILVVLVLTVLRPLVRSLIGPARAALLPATPAPVNPGLAVPERAAAALPSAQSPGVPMDYEQQVAQARTLVTQDPKRVAQVVKTWVSGDE